MAAIDEKLVARVVGEVLTRLSTQPSASAAKAAPSQTAYGVYEDMNAAVEAAQRSFEKLRAGGMTARKKAIAVIRKLCVQKAKEWGEIEFNETKIGRLDHKIEKLSICGELVPGVEMIDRMAFSGDSGLTVIDYAPWGVIGAITPSTHSVPTLTGNAIKFTETGEVVVNLSRLFVRSPPEPARDWTSDAYLYRVRVK